MNIFIEMYLPMSMIFIMIQGMTGEKPSSSTETVTAGGTAEPMKPQDERICYDPLAKNFLGRKFTLFRKSRFLTKLALLEG